MRSGPDRETVVRIGRGWAAGLLVLLAGCEPIDEPPVETPLAFEHARLLDPPWTIAEFMLTDQTGRDFGRSDLADHWTLVFSGFTHCPDICPATLSVLQAAQRELADMEDLRIVFVTVDPARDTTDVLADYLAWFDENWIGLTGETDQLRALLDSLQMASVRVPTGNGDYTMDHATAVVLVDPEARARAYWPAPIDAADLAADLARLPGR